MGCGASSSVETSLDTANGHSKPNGNGVTNGHGRHDDDLPTVVLPDTPVLPKPPIAFEIPLDEFDGGKRPNTPPPHLQRLLQPPQADISLPDIEEKLAIAEQRRLSILQQRAASAQKRVQKAMKTMYDAGRPLNENGQESIGKHGSNSLTIPPEPGICEDKNIA